MAKSIFVSRVATLPAQTPEWSPPSIVSISYTDLEIYGIVWCVGEWLLTFVWLTVVLNMFPHIRFKNISISCRVSLCLVAVCFELLKVSYGMYRTVYYYHTIVCSIINIIATTFALLFSLGPLSVLRGNNRKNLMPIIPKLSPQVLKYVLSCTTFHKNRAIIYIRFINYELLIGRRAYNGLLLKNYKDSLLLYLKTLAQHIENEDYYARMLIAIDHYGFIRSFIPRLPSTPLIQAYRGSNDQHTLFELVSIEFKGDSKVRYFYADLHNIGFPLNDMQKKSILWLLCELNDSATLDLRVFCVRNYIDAGLSENIRSARLYNSRLKSSRRV